MELYLAAALLSALLPAQAFSRRLLNETEPIEECSMGEDQPGCTVAMAVNEFCEQECNNAKCDYDSGMCSAYCNSMCRYDQIGDSICDDGCNIEFCQFDKGDCTSFQSSIYQVISIVGFCLISGVFLWYSLRSLCITLLFYIRRHRMRVDSEAAREISSETARVAISDLIERYTLLIPFSKETMQFDEETCVICLDE